MDSQSLLVAIKKKLSEQNFSEEFSTKNFLLNLKRENFSAKEFKAILNSF